MIWYWLRTRVLEWRNAQRSTGEEQSGEENADGTGILEFYVIYVMLMI